MTINISYQPENGILIEKNILLINLLQIFCHFGNEIAILLKIVLFLNK